ncbi:MAG: hypothetical protein HQL76_04110 [Magnetococcales bacterium]|nr:hypothetical protein [Magnetococcales bacterium]
MEHPADSDEARVLEQSWRANPSPTEIRHRKELIPQIAASLRFATEEFDDPLLRLPWYAWNKRNRLKRYRISINALLWLWALREAAPELAHDTLQAVQPLYSASSTRWSVSWRRIMHDLDFFHSILDNYREEGFLSVAQHVVWRVHGDFVAKPYLLEVAVALMLHMDRTFEEFRVAAHQWAGRQPPAVIDRVSSLLDAEAFSGNF